MGLSPPIAKVSRPTSTGYFPRHRLYRLLDKARKASVLWITGPPGCGKAAEELLTRDFLYLSVTETVTPSSPVYH